jgi:hypothetical protein
MVVSRDRGRVIRVATAGFLAELAVVARSGGVMSAGAGRSTVAAARLWLELRDWDAGEPNVMLGFGG